jgi:hypothetical protein
VGVESNLNRDLVNGTIKKDKVLVVDNFSIVSNIYPVINQN